MSGSSPAAAVNAFVAPLQRAVACVSAAVLDVSGGYHVADAPHALMLADGDAAPLRSLNDLSLWIHLNYTVAALEGRRRSWGVRTTGYVYQLRAGERELLAYHWHPRGLSPHTDPHMHLGAAAELRFADLGTAHLPTGRLGLEDVLRLAIRDLGVEARRDDWRQVLDEAHSDLAR